MVDIKSDSDHFKLTNLQNENKDSGVFIRLTLSETVNKKVIFSHCTVDTYLSCNCFLAFCTDDWI